MKLHPDLTPELLEDMMRDSLFGMGGMGACNACGAEAYGVEPDAENYTCEDCGESEVYGAERLFLECGD